MKVLLPAVSAVMDRRILLNFRVDPVVLERLVPAPFRVKRIHCWGLAGICLIRLRDTRPRGLPRQVGFVSENAAFRIAVEWDEGGGVRNGVYIPIRHTNSRLNSLAGGRLFPGRHELSTFEVHETRSLFKIELRARNRDENLKLICRRTKAWPADSIFADESHASAFIREGCAGYSPGLVDGRFEGVELRATKWRTSPLAVEHLDAPFFTNQERFHAGAIRFDSALLMEDIAPEWGNLGRLKTPDPGMAS